ncbi:MAG: hypothetical protein WA778_03940 [Pseudolabrys sp.]
MKLGILAAAAAFSVVGVTSASAQVYIADPYLADSYTYVAPPVYAAPPPVHAAPAARVVIAPGPVILGEPVYAAPPPIGGYAPPKYSYTINSRRYGVIYSGY